MLYHEKALAQGQNDSPVNCFTVSTGTIISSKVPAKFGGSRSTNYDDH